MREVSSEQRELATGEFRAPVWMLVVVGLLLLWIYTYRMNTNPLKWEESKRCLAATEMIHSGDYVVPTMLGEPYPGQPPLQDWLLVLLAQGDPQRVGALTVRLLSLLALAGTCLFLWRLGGSEDRRPSLLPVLVCLTMVTVLQSGRSGEIDTLFTFFVLAALGTVELGRRSGSPWVQWFVPQLFVAAGVLTKLIAPLYFYPPVLYWAWRRRNEVRFSPLAFASGLLAMLVAVAAWLVPYSRIVPAGALGDPWMSESLVRTVSRGWIENPLHFLAYPLLLLIWTLPWSLAACGLKPASWLPGRNGITRDPWLALCLAAAGWCALVFLFVPERESRDLLPVLPCLSVLFSAVLVRAASRAPGAGSRLPGALVLLGLVYGIAHAGFVEVREARRGEPFVEAARVLAMPHESDEPIVCSKEVNLELAFELSRILGRPLRRASPEIESAFWIGRLGPARANLEAPLAESPPFAAWRISEPETWSLLGGPLFPSPLSGDIRARRIRDLGEAVSAHNADPDDPDAVIWLGRRIAYLGHYRKAVSTYTEGIERWPGDPRFYRHRGHRFISLRRFDDAIADLSRAAALIEGRPDEVEPDGLPNDRDIPTSTLGSNIWYHLGLAHYLKGDWTEAERCYRKCLEFSKTPDMLTATTHWLYMTLRRAGRVAEARVLLDPITADMNIIENRAYHQLLLMYKGEIDPDALLESAIEAGGTDLATIGYGVGNRNVYDGDRAEAEKIFRRIVEGDAWSAFGHLAAEADVSRMIDRAL